MTARAALVTVLLAATLTRCGTEDPDCPPTLDAIERVGGPQAACELRPLAQADAAGEQWHRLAPRSVAYSGFPT